GCRLNPERLLRLFLLFRGHGQTEHRYLPPAGDVLAARIVGARQIDRLAMLAAVDLGMLAIGFLHVAAILLDDVGHIEPALQVTTAQLALLVSLVAGALPLLLELYLVVRKLLRF